MSSPAVRQIDHVNVLSEDPGRTAPRLGGCARATGQRPPSGVRPSSVAILAAGNVTLESIRWGGRSRPAAGIALTGVVFEPDGTAGQSAAELRARGVPHVAPLAFGGPLYAL